MRKSISALLQKKRLCLFIGVAVLIALVLVFNKPSKVTRLPHLTLHTVSGTKLALDSLKGKTVLITFWSTSCSICIKEIPHLITLYNTLGNDTFEIVAIAMPYDPPNRIVSLSSEKEIPYPVAFDIQGEAVKAFGHVQNTPTSFLVNPKGHIVAENKGALNIDSLKKTIQAL